MKKTIRYIMALLALVPAAVLSSCSDEFSQPPVILPEGGLGTGEWDSPMTAYQCRIGSVNENVSRPWVTGYIVGVVNTAVGNVLNERCAQFEGPFAVNTNLLIALTPDEKDWSQCATVQLPSGSVRDALNLSSNPGNLGRQVSVRGTTGEKYCGVYGLRDASDYNWGPTGNQPVELKPIEGPFWTSFEATTNFDTYEQSGWSNVMVSGGLSGWYIRNFDGNNYITCSAYKGSATGGPYENWLITPAIDLDKIADKTLEFRTQAAYTADDSTLEVFVMTSDKPAASQNTRLEAAIARAVSTSYTSWVNSGKLDLSGFSGTIYIGWRYYSARGGDGNSTTYCIDDINIGNATEPMDPKAPVVSDAVYEGLGEDEASIDWNYDNVLLPSGVSSVWSWKEYGGKHYLNGSAFGGSARDCVSIAYSPAVSLEGVTGASVTFDHAAKFQTTIQKLARFVVRVKGASEWTEYEIPAWPPLDNKWTFVNSGTIDISAFDGKEIEIGFKYVSSAAGADTWEIRNVKVKKGE